MIEASLNPKEWFFDRAVVTNAMDAAERRTLSKIGAFVMTTARQSMRTTRAGRSSPPGSPPFAHVGSLKKGPFGVTFRYDPQSKSVVVGASPFKSGANAPVPHIEEFGGTVTVRYRTGKRKGQTVRHVYPARPYMGPALEKNLAAIPEAFRDSIQRSG